MEAKTKTTLESKQYLTFMLDKEIFAFEVLKVKEVLEVTRVTKVPKTPPFMTGVINLRGGVVPVIDLRVKFDMAGKDHNVDTAIIIVETEFDGETIVIGALVDGVKEVIRLDASQIEAPPKVGMNVSGEYIENIGKKGSDFIIILAAGKVFSQKELEYVRDVSRTEDEAVAV
ncbi:MAG: purine-binding chemotaxis protein CheW [Spirochaetes bacterium]|nr:purine-binding chemotaxis protein CheW [Spirochaetota bacterium]